MVESNFILNVNLFFLTYFTQIFFSILFIYWILHLGQVDCAPEPVPVNMGIIDSHFSCAQSGFKQTGFTRVILPHKNLLADIIPYSCRYEATDLRSGVFIKKAHLILQEALKKEPVFPAFTFAIVESYGTPTVPTVECVPPTASQVFNSTSNSSVGTGKSSVHAVNVKQSAVPVAFAFCVIITEA